MLSCSSSSHKLAALFWCMPWIGVLEQGMICQQECCGQYGVDKLVPS